MLAAAARMQDDNANASKFYELTLGIAGRCGDRGGVAGELMNLAYVHLHEHDPEWAGRLFAESASIHRELHDEAGTAWNIAGFAAARYSTMARDEIGRAEYEQLERDGRRLSVEDALGLAAK